MKTIEIPTDDTNQPVVMALPRGLKSDIRDWKTLPRKWFRFRDGIYFALFLYALFLLPMFVSGNFRGNQFLMTLPLFVAFAVLFSLGCHFYSTVFLNRISLVHPEFLIKNGEIHVSLHRFSPVLSDTNKTVLIFPLDKAEFMWKEISEDVFFLPAGITSPKIVLMVRMTDENAIKTFEANINQNSKYIPGARYRWSKDSLISHPFTSCCCESRHFELWKNFLLCEGMTIQGAFSPTEQ